MEIPELDIVWVLVGQIEERAFRGRPFVPAQLEADMCLSYPEEKVAALLPYISAALRQRGDQLRAHADELDHHIRPRSQRS